MTRKTRLLLPHTLTAAQKTQPGIFVIRASRDPRVYIGATTHLAQACNKARHDLRAGTHGSKPLQAFATTHGLHKLRFEALELCPVDQLPAAKQRHLDQHQASDPAHGFNSLNPAGPTGRKMSPEARARISAGKTGKTVQRTPEHQEKLAAAHRGRKRSPATCAAISAATKGKKKHRKTPPAA